MAAAKNPVDTHTTIPLPGGAVWIDLDNTIDGARCLPARNVYIVRLFICLPAGRVIHTVLLECSAGPRSGHTATRIRDIVYVFGGQNGARLAATSPASPPPTHSHHFRSIPPHTHTTTTTTTTRSIRFDLDVSDNLGQAETQNNPKQDLAHYTLTPTLT